uniref:Uncharacterized protein n=1 Tax=Leersia perrieri TaxID=77586 RepID=A0A0D9WYA2_9ORYZ
MAAARTLLRLRSSEGTVMVAPAWDERPPAAALPLDTGVPSRALENALCLWIRHALADGAADGDWLAEFRRRLRLDGLEVDDVAAAIDKLRCLSHAIARVIPDFDFSLYGTNGRRRRRVRRRRAEEEEEPAARRVERRKTRSQTAAAAAADAKSKRRRKIVIIDSSKCLPVPAPRKADGPSLRARRGLPELPALLQQPTCSTID